MQTLVYDFNFDTFNTFINFNNMFSKIENYVIRILFLLGISAKLKRTAYLVYFAGWPDIVSKWNESLTWFDDPDHWQGNGMNNYHQITRHHGVFIVRAKMDAGHKEQIPAVWMLYIDTGNTYEELDFEIIESPSRKKRCLYISSYINHKNSNCHYPGTDVLEAKKWQVRICNQKLIDKLLYSFNNFTFEIRSGIVKWYINDRLIAKQRVDIKQPLYFVLSNVHTCYAKIWE